MSRTLASLLAAATLTLSTGFAHADQPGYYRTIEVKPITTSSIALTLVPGSIVHGEPGAMDQTKICKLQVTIDGLEKNVALAPTAFRKTMDVTAGRYCMIFPLEHMVELMNASHGKISVNMREMLTETRELVTMTGDPHQGQCKRALDEWVEIQLPSNGGSTQPIYLGDRLTLGYTTAADCGL